MSGEGECHRRHGDLKPSRAHVMAIETRRSARSLVAPTVPVLDCVGSWFITCIEWNCGTHTEQTYLTGLLSYLLCCNESRLLVKYTGRMPHHSQDADM